MTGQIGCRSFPVLVIAGIALLAAYASAAVGGVALADTPQENDGTGAPSGTDGTPLLVELEVEEQCDPLGLRYEALLRADPDFEGASISPSSSSGELFLQVARVPEATLTELPLGSIREDDPRSGEVRLAAVVAELGLAPHEAELVARAYVLLPDGRPPLTSEWAWLAFDCAYPEAPALYLEVRAISSEIVEGSPEVVVVRYGFALRELGFQNVWSLKITDDRLDVGLLQDGLDAALATAYGAGYLPAGQELKFELECELPIIDFLVDDDGSRVFSHRTSVIGIGDNTGSDVEGWTTTEVILPPETAAGGGDENVTTVPEEPARQPDEDIGSDGEVTAPLVPVPDGEATDDDGSRTTSPVVREPGFVDSDNSYDGSRPASTVGTEPPRVEGAPASDASDEPVAEERAGGSELEPSVDRALPRTGSPSGLLVLLGLFAMAMGLLCWQYPWARLN